MSPLRITKKQTNLPILPIRKYQNLKFRVHNANGHLHDVNIQHLLKTRDFVVMKSNIKLFFLRWNFQFLQNLKAENMHKRLKISAFDVWLAYLKYGSWMFLKKMWGQNCNLSQFYQCFKILIFCDRRSHPSKIFLTLDLFFWEIYWSSEQGGRRKRRGFSLPETLEKINWQFLCFSTSISFFAIGKDIFQMPRKWNFFHMLWLKLKLS